MRSNGKSQHTTGAVKTGSGDALLQGGGKGTVRSSRILGTSSVAQRLRLYLLMQGVQVQSLVGELRSHKLRDQKNQNINTEAIL